MAMRGGNQTDLSLIHRRSSRLDRLSYRIARYRFMNAPAEAHFAFNPSEVPPSEVDFVNHVANPPKHRLFGLARPMRKRTHYCPLERPTMNRMLLGYSPDFDLFVDAATPRQAVRTGRKAVVFDFESTDQAAELLDAAGRPGFGALLHRMLERAASKRGGVLNNAVALELVALLQDAARHTLPQINAPQSIDARTNAKRKGRFFGVELEGLSPEDQEFELARRFGQLADAAATEAAQASQSLPPKLAALLAAARAATRFAPGWCNPDAPGPTLPPLRDARGRTPFRSIAPPAPGNAPLPTSQGDRHA